MAEGEKNSKGITLTPKTMIILIVVAILLVAGGVILGLNWNRWFGDTPVNSDEFTPDIDPDAQNWTGGELSAQGDGASEGIQIPGYPSITIQADTTDVTMALLNPEGNPCYFTFELVLSDTDEVLYTSKMVPPGQMVSDITLSRALSPGEYNATIRITTASLEDGSAMNGANVETLLIVQ